MPNARFLSLSGLISSVSTRLLRPPMTRHLGLFVCSSEAGPTANKTHWLPKVYTNLGIILPMLKGLNPWSRHAIVRCRLIVWSGPGTAKHPDRSTAYKVDVSSCSRTGMSTKSSSKMSTYEYYIHVTPPKIRHLPLSSPIYQETQFQECLCRREKRQASWVFWKSSFVAWLNG